MTYNLRELGINSEYRAAEFEHELGIRFSDFTSEQIDTWQRQTICLNQYAYTRTYSSAASGRRCHRLHHRGMGTRQRARIRTPQRDGRS